jgi:hypothetical protein
VLFKARRIKHLPKVFLFFIPITSGGCVLLKIIAQACRKKLCLDLTIPSALLLIFIKQSGTMTGAFRKTDEESINGSIQFTAVGGGFGHGCLRGSHGHRNIAVPALPRANIQTFI